MQEYQLKVKVRPYKRLEKERDMHLQAYLNNAATATVKKQGKIVSAYPSFNDFFNYDKRLKEIEGETKKKEERSLTNLERIVLKANSQKGG